MLLNLSELVSRTFFFYFSFLTLFCYVVFLLNFCRKLDLLLLFWCDLCTCHRHCIFQELLLKIGLQPFLPLFLPLLHHKALSIGNSFVSCLKIVTFLLSHLYSLFVKFLQIVCNTQPFQVRFHLPFLLIQVDKLLSRISSLHSPVQVHLCGSLRSGSLQLASFYFFSGFFHGSLLLFQAGTNCRIDLQGLIGARG